jgi:hypothetical protein
MQEHCRQKYTMQNNEVEEGDVQRKAELLRKSVKECENISGLLRPSYGINNRQDLGIEALISSQYAQ